jgi:hypothetical protein
VRRSPRVEAVNPLVNLLFEHGLGCFAAAKIGKSKVQRKKKWIFPYFRSVINRGLLRKKSIENQFKNLSKIKGR